MKKKKLLWLYSEIAGYLLNCIKHQVAETDNPFEFHIVRWPINSEAPLQLEEIKNVTWYVKSDYSEAELQKLCIDLKPDHVFCSGWNDKTYMTITKTLKPKIPVTLLLDNYWENTIRQHVASLIGPYFLKRHFSSVWVPGNLHEKYAKKIGFKSKNIHRWLYIADVKKFDEHYQKDKIEKLENYPHRFLYVGRYLTLKGVEDLWNAFIRFKDETNNNWELWMVGAGELFDTKPVHPAIKHFGFIQPNELPQVIKGSGVFIMPSHYDHWGVAVHEFAAAGLPLICSDKVGATSHFLKANENGYLHPIKSPTKIKAVMKMMSEKTDSELIKMGKISNTLANSLTIQHWQHTLKEIVN